MIEVEQRGMIPCGYRKCAVQVDLAIAMFQPALLFVGTTTALPSPAVLVPLRAAEGDFGLHLDTEGCHGCNYQLLLP